MATTLTPTERIMAHCTGNGLRVPVQEFQFCAWRDWRFDFCWPWPGLRLALELQGGWTGGRHSRGPGMQNDYEKHAIAMILGWRVLYATPGQVVNGKALVWLDRLLKGG